jgi:hypothetical protein
MKRKSIFLSGPILSRPVAAVALLYVVWLGEPAKVVGQASVDRGDDVPMVAAVGPGNTIVHSQYGGQIFGFDIDQNGTEGVLSEAQDFGGGKVLAAVETFDRTTGKILKVVQKLETKDDFLTLGIVGTSLGLVEHEHVQGIYVVSRIYEELKPLNSNKFTSTWTPPLAKNDIIMGVSQSQGFSTTAVLASENGGSNSTFVFGSNVAANTFGRLITLTDPVFTISPVMAFDTKTNQAVVAAATGAVGGPPPKLALVNLTTGTVTEFTGIPGPPPYRQGYVNGIAVDSEDGIACTTTEIDARVEFYNLKTKTGFAVALPGGAGQYQSGENVEYDAVHKLFLVAQPNSSTGPGSSIQVYDTQGNLVESLNGFSFPVSTNAMFALHPSDRSGYVYGPSGMAEIQSFTY